MAIKNYAIIDHAGSVGACKALYKKAYEIANNGGYEKVWRLNEVCQIYSPYAKEITNKMKYFNRYNRTPKMVYIICFNQCESKAQFIANIWETRGIPVTFIEESPTPTFAVDKMSTARRCALIWGKAMGQQFSAPLVRDPLVETIDEYTARPHMDREQGSYSAKRFTNPQTYINAFRAVASEAECQEFFETYCYKAGYDKLPNGSRVFNKERGNLLAEFLEPGWKLCPNCGKPVYENSTNCTFCDTEFDAVETETFWDDSYHDDYDLNYEARTASLPNISDIEWSHAEASTAKYKKELPWIQMLNTIQFDFA